MCGQKNEVLAGVPAGLHQAARRGFVLSAPPALSSGMRQLTGVRFTCVERIWNRE